MKDIIKKILKEEINSKIINFTLDRLRSGKITPPYFKNLENLGLSDEEIKLILEEFTGGKVFINVNTIIDKKHGQDIYSEWGGKHWSMRKYNESGKIIRIEDSEGFWENRKYDERGNEIYYENSDGSWGKSEYDERGNEIYFENSDGQWYKSEYNKNDELIYRETSKQGVFLDER